MENYRFVEIFLNFTKWLNTAYCSLCVINVEISEITPEEVCVFFIKRD